MSSQINLNNGHDQFVVSDEVYGVRYLDYTADPQTHNYVPFKFIAEFPKSPRWAKVRPPDPGMVVVVVGTILRRETSGPGAGMYVVQVKQYVYPTVSTNTPSILSSPASTPGRRRRAAMRSSTLASVDDAPPEDQQPETPVAGPGGATQAAMAGHVTEALGPDPDSPSERARGKRARGA